MSLTQKQKNQLLMMTFLLMFIVACSSGPDRDMSEFVSKAKLNTPPKIAPLPLFLEYQSFKYNANTLRSPFESVTPTKSKPLTNQKGPSPNLNRPKEPLESFPLDSLQMVGTISKNGMIYALIRDNKGLIYRVGVGNYIGHNFGRIESITHNGLDIKEWVLNSHGEWQTRTIPLYVTEKQGSGK